MAVWLRETRMIQGRMAYHSGEMCFSLVILVFSVTIGKWQSQCASVCNVL